MNAAEIPSTVEQLVQVVNYLQDRVESLEARLVSGVRVDIGSKSCVVCGVEFVRSHGEGASNYRRRRTCGPKCRSKLLSRSHRVEVQPKSCVVCGSEIPRGDLRPSAYEKRNTCSRKCLRLHLSKSQVAAQKRRRGEVDVLSGVRPNTPRSDVEAWTRAANVVREFGGLPVTDLDVSDLTGMSPERARRMLGLLTAGGVVGSRVDERGVSVWFDPAVERAA